MLDIAARDPEMEWIAAMKSAWDTEFLCRLGFQQWLGDFSEDKSKAEWLFDVSFFLSAVVWDLSTVKGVVRG